MIFFLLTIILNGLIFKKQKSNEVLFLLIKFSVHIFTNNGIILVCLKSIDIYYNYVRAW